MTILLGTSQMVEEEPSEKRELPAARGTMLFSLVLLSAFAAVALLAPLIAGDHGVLNAANRLKPPSAAHWLGTDHLGRDVFARTMVGSRSSLLVGATVALVSVSLGTLIGLYAGYFRFGERVIMGLMDALMAIPGVLLAIALGALLGAGLSTVIIAITVPEIPRVVRLVRGTVLALKDQPFIAASVSVGTPTYKILLRHILPNSVGVLTVQATYVCAAAIMTESVLSFLGVGIPPDIPSWGNVMAAGRQYFQLAPWIIGFPGAMLSLLVLTINIFGDSLRDGLDPRLAKRTRL